MHCLLQENITYIGIAVIFSLILVMMAIAGGVILKLRNIKRKIKVNTFSLKFGATIFVSYHNWSVVTTATQITHRSMLPSRTLNQQMVIIYVYMYIVHRNVTSLSTFTTEHH